MLIATWILAALLTLVFLAAGLLKVVRPKVALATSGQSWVEDFPAPFVKLVGALEVIGALGLILPLVTSTGVVLTPVAAIGLAVLMIGAAVVHVRRNETPVPPIVLAVLAVATAVLGFATLL